MNCFCFLSILIEKIKWNMFCESLIVFILNDNPQ